MVSLDTVNLTLPVDCLVNLNPDCYKKVEETESGVTRAYWIANQTKTNYSGLNKVTVFDDCIKLTTSAKILGKDYHKGVNIQTLPTYFDCINESGVIELNPELSKNMATVDYYHISQNIELPVPVKDAIPFLYTMRNNRRYEVKPYDNGGIAYKLTANKKRYHRLIMYGKRADMLRKTFENELFQKRVSKEDILKRYTDKTLRVEANMVRHTVTRELLDIDDKGAMPLMSILTSAENPIYKLYNIIRRPDHEAKNMQLFLFNPDDHLVNFAKYEKMRGQIAILQDLNFDLYEVDRIINLAYSSRDKRSAKKREYSDIMRNVELSKLKEVTGIDIPILDEIAQLLFAA